MGRLPAALLWDVIFLLLARSAFSFLLWLVSTRVRNQLRFEMIKKDLTYDGIGRFLEEFVFRLRIKTLSLICLRNCFFLRSSIVLILLKSKL